MNMRINTTGCNNKVFSCQSLCWRTNSHIWCYAVHNIWVACFTYANNFSIFNTNISLYNTSIIYNKGVSNNKVKIAVSTCSIYWLTHTISDCLTSTKLNFITINCIVLFNFNYKICVSKSNLISNRRTIHHCIFFATNFTSHS